MTHRTKRMLIFIYMAVTVIGFSRLFLARDVMGGGIAAPETLALLLWVLSADAVGLMAAIRHLAFAGLILLEVGAPVCACFRVYWPFIALLGVKLLLAGLWVAMAQGIMLWLFALHALVLVLAVCFFRRKLPEDAAETEISGVIPGDMHLHPSQVQRMGRSFPQ